MTQKEFESIELKMIRKYSRIKHGEENERRPLINAIEGNAIKVYAENQAVNSRRMDEALLLCLHYINDRISGTSTDTTKCQQPAACRGWGLN